MRQPTADQVLYAFQQKGYRLFDNGKENPVAIRSNNSQAGEFDDWLCLLRRDGDTWNLRAWRGTTDPGLYYLRDHLLDDSGCAILAPQQAKDVYKLDLHRGKYRALCQRNGPVKIYRDLNRDSVLDCDPRKLQSGWFGINWHYDGYAASSTKVFKASAGCQVFAVRADFFEFREDLEKSAEKFGNLFDGTLLEERDLSVVLDAKQEAPEKSAWHLVEASSFADPADVAAFKKAKKRGLSDKEAFKYGDNGIGCWGDDTTGSTPMCALPPEEWKHLGDAARGALVWVRRNAGEMYTVCELRDTMPAYKNIKNGCGLDLNPAACSALGLTPPVSAMVEWRFAPV